MSPKTPRVVKCTIEAAEYAKIEKLAERMGMTPTRLASLLLQAGLEDNELTIRGVSFIAEKLKAAASSISGEKRKPAR